METVFVGPAPRIALSVHGNGPLVLFLHGIGGNRHHWREQLPIFASRFKAAAWDARGYGDSDDYEGPLQFSVFSEGSEGSQRDLLWKLLQWCFEAIRMSLKNVTHAVFGP